MSGTKARHTSETARQAKAWCYFGGGTSPYIVQDFNVSSVADVSGGNLGQYTVNFENNMSTSDYVCVTAGAVTTDGRVATVWANSKSTSSVDMFGLPNYNTIAYVDIGGMDIAIFSH